jgi:hypothetical protein
MQNGSPTVVQRFGDSGYWWEVSDGARYGDVAAYRDDNDAYIYGWGGAPTNITDYVGSQYVYQIRVATSGAWDQTQYEYWWGRDQGWQLNTPLTNFTAETAVMWGVGQGSTYWSPKYQCYFYVHFAGADGELYTDAIHFLLFSNDTNSGYSHGCEARGPLVGRRQRVHAHPD